MSRKKISKEHLQELLERFDKDEKINSTLLVYAILILIFNEVSFLFVDTLGFSFVIGIVLILAVFLIPYFFSRSFSIKLKGKKNKELVQKMKSYLVKGEFEEDKNIQKTREKLTLTESHYKISQLLYTSYLLLETSILLLISQILGYIGGQISELLMNIGLTINISLFLILTVRYLNFRNIRKIRQFLYNIISKELKKLESEIEELLDLKISEFQLEESTKDSLQKWSDLYLGSHFIGLRTLMLISDYKNLIYNLNDERYYFNLFNDLKFKIKEVQHYFSDETIKKSLELMDYILKLLDLNIERLNVSIQSKLNIKEEHRTRVRMIQTWFTIIGIVISILFSSLNFMNSLKI